MPVSSPQTDDISFEDAMQRLDEIVAGMEGSQLPLEEMITSYEEGVRLLRVCRQRIESARRRVELITTDLETGRATLAPFDEEASGAGGLGMEPESPALAPAASAPLPAAAPRRRKSSSASAPEAEPDSGEIRLF